VNNISGGEKITVQKGVNADQEIVSINPFFVIFFSPPFSSGDIVPLDMGKLGCLLWLKSDPL
jgi:hypothetical protein